MKTKIQADTTFGIYRVDEFEGDILSQQDFYEALKNLQQGEIVCAEVDSYTLMMIRKEYDVSI